MDFQSIVFEFALKPITIGDNALEELDLKLISKEDLIEKIKTTF